MTYKASDTMKSTSSLSLRYTLERIIPIVLLTIYALIAIFPVIGLLGSFIVFVVLVINLVMVLSKGSSLYDQVGETRVVRAR